MILVVKPLSSFGHPLSNHENDESSLVEQKYAIE